MHFTRILLCALSTVASLQCAAAAGELTGDWRIVSIRNVAHVDQTKARASFADNGRFGASVGCNRIMGQPTLDGDRLSFGGLASTRMACIGPLGAVETKFLEALEATASYRVTSGRLSLLDDSGAVVVVMTRSK